jgi:hypothetical protein
MRISPLFLCAALAPASALAADPSLLSLVMPDAKVIAGASVDQAKSTPFGAYVLNRLQPDDPNFAKFVNATGFDPRRDVTELVIASNYSQNDPTHWLVLAKGSFDPARITAAATTAGGIVRQYRGIPVITTKPEANEPQAPKASRTAIAFLDGSTAAMGDVNAVEAAIGRRKANAGVSTPLASKVQQVSANNDFWFTSVVPLSQFANAMPDQNVAGAMQGNLLGAVQQASGGVKFGPTVQLNAEALTRSPKDAAALVDVVKFVAGLIQTNRQSDTTAAQVSTLLDSLKATAQGNLMTMTLSIPETTLEQMISSVRRPRKAPQPTAPAK